MDQVAAGEAAAGEAVLFQRGQALRAAGRRREAIEALQAASRLNPDRPETLLSLGVLHLQQDLPQAALALIRRTLALRAGDSQAWDALGHVQTALGDHPAAFEAFSKACRLAPAQLPFRLHRTEAAVRCGQAEALALEFEIESTANPLAAAPLLGLGLIHIREHRIDAAIDQLEAALALDRDSAAPPMLLGMAYSLALQPARAAPLLRLALDRDPGNTCIANDLAVTLARLFRYEEGVALLDSTIAEFGPSVISLSNLATAKAALGEMQAASAAAQAAMRLAPGNPGPARAWCNLLPYQDDISPGELLAALQKSARLLPKREALGCNVSREPQRPLRIGLLSNLLRTHPAGWLTLAGLEALDRKAFSIHCFGRFDPSDRLANRFAGFAAAWHRTEALDDPGLAKLIHENRIDILIDLGGFGDAGRIDVCAWRPAPLQIKWVGMQYHSTGLDFIDYFLTDSQETPAGFEAFYSEKLLRLPDGYVCYLPPDYAPEVGPLPAPKNRHITFGCLNNLMKITPATLTAWSEILREIPDAQLLLRCPQFSDPGPRARITDFLGQRGVSPERLQLAGRTRHRDFLATYNQIDIALDPFPYSGGLSTCEALYMGVPVLTRAGEIFAARHSVSHLANTGLHHWIAGNTGDYIAKAKFFAANLPQLAELRAGLRARITASPLCDAQHFGQNLGAALRRVWQAYCEGNTGK
jgi:predicted O-linked N-acetylglucosamine transferase (SPINDLY family)